MAARITRQEVEHVARLARLALTEEEVEALTHELGAILDHAADVSALDTADVPPTAHPLPLVNILRPDEARAAFDHVVKTYPESNAASLARQGLAQLAPPARQN